MALKIDELNNLTTSAKKKRAIPYREFFEEMGLDEEQVEERVEHSKKLAPILFFVITLIVMMIEEGYEEFNDAVEELVDEILDLFDEEGLDIDDELRDYVDDFAKEFVEHTAKRYKEEFFVSEDRAEVVAENEANTVYNYEDFRRAVAKGEVYKIWVTKEDEKVRITHAEQDNVAIPILDNFEVGGYPMRFPKDTLYGAPLQETANCRCTIKYFKPSAE